MHSDDLVPILARSVPVSARLYQGVALAWNTSTGANTVAIGSAVFEDMPIIGAANVAGISTGNPVMVIGYGNDMYVLGRLIKP